MKFKCVGMYTISKDFALLRIIFCVLKVGVLSWDMFIGFQINTRKHQYGTM